MKRRIVPGLPFALCLTLSFATVGSSVSWQDSGFFLCAVRELDLLHLKGLTNLRRLNLYSAKLTDEGMKALEEALPGNYVRYWFPEGRSRDLASPSTFSRPRLRASPP